MQAGRKRMLIGAAIALAVLIADAPAAMAQLVQSDVESETPTPETSQLVTSSTEVRRAVIGLIALAVMVALLGIWYWFKTGKQAADRHAHKFGGRHHGGAGAPTPVPGAPAGDAIGAVGAPSSMTARTAAAGPAATSPRRVPPGGLATAGGTRASSGQSTLAPSLMADPGLAGAAGFASGFGTASSHTAATPSSSVFSPSPSLGSRAQSTASVYDSPMNGSTWSTTPEPRPGGTSTAMGATQLPAMPAAGRPPLPSSAPAPTAPVSSAPAAPPQVHAVDVPAARRSPAPLRPDETVRPSARAGSPYPDGAAPGAQQASEGRWATLRRDLFG